jgi:iron complex transport system substrate-binding protein
VQVRTSTHRRLAAVAAVGALALSLAACGGSDDDASASPTDDSTAGTDAFPVTIDSTLGEATIDAKPERVVALGWGAADIAFTLGTVPVGIESDDWAGDADGYQPWFREAVEKQGAKLPETITMYPELDVEKIIGLDPDLILAPQSGLTQDQFDQLSDFAPVVAYPGDAWATPVDDQIRIAAKALGVPEKADGIIADQQAAYDAVKAEHPEFAGVTFAYVYGGDQPGALAVYMPGDTRVALLTSLGLTLAPSAAALPADPGSFVATLGLENADQLNDADVLFTWFNDTDEQATTEAQPLVATPISIPWALDTYVPQIVDVVAKVS